MHRFGLKRAWRGTARPTEGDAAAFAKLLGISRILSINQRVLLDILEQDEYMLRHLLTRTASPAQAIFASPGRPVRGIRT
jgi:hypothetical protein